MYYNLLSYHSFYCSERHTGFQSKNRDNTTPLDIVESQRDEIWREFVLSDNTSKYVKKKLLQYTDRYK